MGAAEAIENGVAVTVGSDGTDLGTMQQNGSTGESLNCCSRVMWGSNNYAQSAARQWLNSAGGAGSVWTPTNKFDRAPVWAATYNGFLHGLPAEFLEAVQPAIIPCRTNDNFEVASLDGAVFKPNQIYSVKDKFFLLSRPEIFGIWDDEKYKDGELLAYYEGLINTERIKYDAAGFARQGWLRSPLPSIAGYNYYVHDVSGAVSYYSVLSAYGVAPACIIA